MIAQETIADAFPLIRGGGVFLFVVGLAAMLGAAFFLQRYILLGIGAAVATALTIALAAPLSAPYGRPTEFQISALLVAVVAEAIAIAIAGRFVAKRGERQRMGAILIIVGLHFALMTPAFGPPIAGLAIAATLNATTGLALSKYPLAAVWFVDGALKTMAGVVMYFAHHLPWPS